MHCFISFPLFSISPLPLPLLIPVLHLPLPHPLQLCGLLYVTASSCLSLIAGHFSCQLSSPPPRSLTLCPRARHSSTFSSSPAVLRLFCLRHVHPCSPPPPPLLFLPSITCVHAVRGGVLIPRLADRHSNGRLSVCVRMCVLVGCLRNSHGNNSPALVDGCWAGRCVGRQAGGMRGSVL